MKRFCFDLRKYSQYIRYSGVAILRSEVSGSFLNWVWWILDPFLHMMVYAFISVVVFGRSEPHFIPFVFVGQAVWKFVNSTLMKSVSMVRSNKNVLTRIYLPKPILLLSNQYSFWLQFFITMGITVVMCLLDGVVFTWHIIWIPLILAVMLLLSFGVGCILLHVGVYVKDMNNLVSIFLKLVFYLSGVFYNIQARVPEPYGSLLLTANPAAMVMHELRTVLIFGANPSFLRLAIWAAIGMALSWVGVRLVYKYEQSYLKAV